VANQLSSAEPATDATAPAPSGARRDRRLPRTALWLTGAGVLVAGVMAFVLLSGSGQAGPATAASTIVPSDALAYFNLSLDRDRAPVRQALSVAARFPDFPLAGGAVLTRLDAILTGGNGSVDFATQVRPWLGNEAALAVLNTPTSTAGSLLVLAVKDQRRARAFIHQAGAVAHGSYRGRSLEAYSSRAEVAFVRGFLVLGQDASVRAALDVVAGARSSLASSPVYRRAVAHEPGGRVLDAYASLAGVRRLLAPQGGVIGAVGDLLYQPALEGVALAVSPSSAGARLQIHSVLDPTLARLTPPATTPFTPSLQNVMPSGSTVMLDLKGLDRVAPGVLNAGTSAGVAGGIGPLLSRLGVALRAEGVNVADLESIFHAETAVGIVPKGRNPDLLIVARTGDQSRIAAELAQLEVPLAQLFKAPGTSFGSGREALFSDRQVGGITAHQLALPNGFELDYAVADGLVMISTSLQGIAAVTQRARALSQDAGFGSVLAHHPSSVTSMVFVNLAALLALGQQTGLTHSSTYRLLQGDLDKVQAVGLSSTRSAGESNTDLVVRVL
jgi:Protein of unknown function (DUF3352)